MAFDSLFTGISGLNAYQSQIDMISNNIANVGTVGFKGQRMTFADLFYQSQGFASAPTQTNGGVNPQEVGLGVKVNTIDTNFAQGGLQTTGNNADLALNGDGFFILRNTNGTGQPLYTRDGAFSVNPNGVLYDPATGLSVQGFMANANGVVTPGSNPGTITIPLGLQMQATGTGAPTAVKLGPTNDQNFDMSLGGSLDQTQYAVLAQGGTPAPKTVSTTIYDSLGNAHQATITFTPSVIPAGVTQVNDATPTPKTPATCWKYSVAFADGTTASAGSTGFVWFDANGQFINTSGDAAGTQTHTLGAQPSTTDGNAIQITAWPAGDNAALPVPPAGIGLDFSNMAALAGTPTANVTAQNGFAAGTLSNFTIGQDGTITGSFTNGQQKTIAQVAVATFQNEGGLHRVGGNSFQQTANSGLAQIGTANSGRFGAVIAGALEQSNVSLADEFTKMIVAQRAFEANTRGISTADQNMMTVLNIRASEN
jgi:flagellar hook protein FlgE